MTQLNGLALVALIAIPFALAPEQQGPERATALAPVQDDGDVEEEGFDHAHTIWDGVLRAHVRGDRFDYRALKEERAALDEYIGVLEGVTRADHDEWTRSQRYAFWINTYNAHVIKLVVDNYPLDSIKDLSTLFTRVWDKDYIRMPAFHPEGENENLTLNEVEHEILRPTFEDARVHAAINCASIGCPPIYGRAFVGEEERLDRQLDVVTRFFLRDRRRNRFDEANNRVYISEIFNWFEEDFVRDEGSVKEYLIEYAPEGDYSWVRDARISYRDYSWALNEPTR